MGGFIGTVPVVNTLEGSPAKHIMSMSCPPRYYHHRHHSALFLSPFICSFFIITQCYFPFPCLGYVQDLTGDLERRSFMRGDDHY